MKKRIHHPTVKVDEKKVTIRKVCTNCGKLIKIDKGLCPKCYRLKIQGKKVNENEYEDKKVFKF